MKFWPKSEFVLKDIFKLILKQHIQSIILLSRMDYSFEETKHRISLHSSSFSQSLVAQKMLLLLAIIFLCSVPRCRIPKMKSHSAAQLLWESLKHIKEYRINSDFFIEVAYVNMFIMI